MNKKKIYLSLQSAYNFTLSLYHLVYLVYSALALPHVDMGDFFIKVTEMHHCCLLLLTLTAHCDSDLLNQSNTEVAASIQYNFAISIDILITW